MASQSAGFTFENLIRELVFDIPFDPNNTDKYDIPAEKNRFDSNENISIKSSGNGNIDCGDIIRFYNYNFDKTNTIIVVRYEQNDDFKIVKHIYEIDYNREMRDSLFGSVNEQEILEYVESIKNIPKGISGEEVRKSYDYLARKIEIQKTNHMKINISPKIDSKGQRRVQCSIPDFRKSIEKFVKYKSPQTHSSLIRQRSIPMKIQSKRRVRGSVSKDTLLQICRSNKDKVKGYSKMKKPELLDMLKHLNLYS